MRKQYQNEEIDTSRTAVPDTVSVALGELAGELREGLLALAVGTGLQVMTALMEADVTAACGPRGRHDSDRSAVRHGRGPGSVTLGGRRVPVERPRMRATDGSGELAVASYELFSDTEILGRMALERMLAGLSTRHYPAALEPVGAHAEKTATSTSRSAVSRRFVAQTQTALAQLLTADLSGLDLVALMVDGVHFGEHTCVVALGIGIDGTKHPLSLVEGSTENTTLVTELIVGLRERGLDVTKPILVVLDGSKALRRAVRDVFDRPVLGRCQLHKIRNVSDHLPDAAGLSRRLRAGRRGRTDRAGRRARPHSPWRRGEPARRHGRDPHRVAPGRAAHARAHPPLDQRRGKHDLDLSHPRRQRQALARRADGAALVRRRDGRGRQAVSPRERPHAPTVAARHAGEAHPACRRHRSY